MAQRVLVSTIDDIDGKSEAAGTTYFSLDGVSFEIDLCESNRDRLKGALKEYIDNARRTGGRLKAPGGANGSKKPPGRDSHETQRVREWARANGFDVSNQGRLPKAVEAAYEEAHRPQEKPKSKARRRTKAATATA